MSTPLGLAIKPGTAARLGIRQPRRPVLLLQYHERLSADERDRLIEQWQARQGSRKHAVFLVGDGVQWMPHRRDVAYIKAAVKRRIWPFGSSAEAK